MTLAEDSSGILLQEVFPNTTASALDMKAGDVLLEVNGESTKEVHALVHAIGNWRMNDPIRATLVRDGKKLKVKGKVVGKPLETSIYGNVEYGGVPYDGGMLASMMERPKGIENPPVIFFVPGIGCGTLDNYFNPKASVKQLVEGFVKNGYAVYRVDKPNEGDGEGCQECQDMNYEYEVKAFETALKHLKTLPGIDANNIILFGHSLGGITAPLIASKEKVQGVICWGTIANSWYEYELKRLRDQRAMLGYDYERIEREYRERQPFLYDFYVGKMGPEALKEKEEYVELVETFFNGEIFYGMHHYSFFHQLNDVNLAQAWKEADCPALSLHGGFDIAAVDSTWAVATARMVNAFRPGQGEYDVIANTTHHYTFVPSYEDYMRMREDGTMNRDYEQEHYNPAIVKRSTVWIKKILGS